MSKLPMILAAAAFVLVSTPTEAQLVKKATEIVEKAKAKAEKKVKSATDKKRKVGEAAKKDGK